MDSAPGDHIGCGIACISIIISITLGSLHACMDEPGIQPQTGCPHLYYLLCLHVFSLLEGVVCGSWEGTTGQAFFWRCNGIQIWICVMWGMADRVSDAKGSPEMFIRDCLLLVHSPCLFSVVTLLNLLEDPMLGITSVNLLSTTSSHN